MFDKHKGKRQRPDPTKGQIAEQLNSKVDNAQQMTQQILGGMASRMQEMVRRLNTLEMNHDNLTYLTVAMSNIMSKDAELAKAIKDEAERLRIMDFNTASDADNVKKGLVKPEDPKYQTKIGDTITIRVEAFDGITNNPIDELMIFRSKVTLGSNELAIIEQNLLGLAVGDVREWVTTLGPEFRGYKDKVVRFKAEALDIRLSPPKPEPVAEIKPELKIVEKPEETKMEKEN